MIRSTLLPGIGMMVAALLSAAPGVASETREHDAGLEVWNDPTFQKEFLGSYGFQADIEPRVTEVERQQMEAILPLLSSDPDAAAAQLEEVTLPESSAIFDFTLGNLYFQRGDLEGAAKRYRTALAKFPSFRRAHKNLGLIEVRTGRFEKAIQSLSRVIELGGRDALTFGLLGYAYSSTEQYVAAESAYRNAMLLDPGALDWKLGLTQAVFKQQKYGEVFALCEELISEYPNRADFWLLEANAYIGLNQPLKAAENFEIVQRMGKATPQSLYTLGDIYVNQSLWDPALRAYRLAVEADNRQNLDRPLRSVEILAQRGALDQARALLASIQQSHGDQPSDEQRMKMLKLEARIAVAGGQGGNAVGVLQQIVDLDPLDGEALLLLGQHYARADDAERAVFYYERAESIDGYEADAKVRHAQVLVGQSRYREALPLLKRAQEIRPREEVARYLEQVERVARTRD